MEFEINLQHVINSLKQQLAEKAEEAARYSAVASAAVERAEGLETQLADANKEIESIRAMDKVSNNEGP